MRDIYFKAKATANGAWVEGMPYKGLDVGLKVYTGIMQYFEHDGQKVCDYDKIRVDPDTLCVWTGKEDSEGRKIYTGDIVEVYHKGKLLIDAVVKFCDKYSGFYLYSEDIPIGSLGSWHGALKVKLNIHDEVE